MQLIGYRVHLCGSDGHIVEREEFEAKDDAVAVLVARRIFRERSRYIGFELWDRAGRLIYYEDRQKAR